jgi:ankyrin repeat protein
MLLFLGIVFLLLVHANLGFGNREKLLDLINKGDAEGVRQLIKLHPELIEADLERQFHQNATPLMLAAQAGRNEICSNLIIAHANVNAVDKAGHTALMHVLEYDSDNTNLVALLLEHGASVVDRDRWGYTPLFIAVDDSNSMNLNSVVMLFQHGADTKVTNDYGETLLDVARQNSPKWDIFMTLFCATNGEH